MPVHTYTNWNSRPSDEIEQIEPFRKYFFICEGANTETFYFRRLIDLRKQLGIRHGKLVLYRVKSGEMYRDGYVFYRSYGCGYRI